MTETLPLGWLYLPVAFALGALHALEPGHGKSLASAYLVAGKHTWKDAVILGVATTFSHTAVVGLLAVGSLGLMGILPQGQLDQLVRLVGAGALVLVGAWTVFRSSQDLWHGHGHAHGHDHGIGHADHDAKPPRPRGFWGVVVIGLSNGALPCPGALAALLVALSLGKVALGLTTVVTYSLGLATALAAIGVLVVEASRRAQSWLPSDRALLWLPFVSGVLVMGTGVWLLLTR